MWAREPTAPGTDRTGPTRPRPEAFWAGLCVTLSNPKVILFYMGFLPAFMDLSNLSPRDVMLAVSVLLVVLTSVNAAYAFAASRLRGAFTSGRVARRLNRGAACVMIGTGGYVMTR